VRYRGERFTVQQNLGDAAMAKIPDFLTTAQRMEMIVSKTMKPVVPGLVLAAVV